MILPQDVLDDCFVSSGMDRLAAAEALADDAVQSYSEDGRLRQLQGLLRHRLGDFLGARTALESAALLAPLGPAPRCVLAECYARTGCTERASELFQEILADSGFPKDLLPAVATGLGSLGEYQAALEACREVIRRDPDHHQAHFGVAFYRRRLGDSPHAILPSVIRAHELAPEVSLYRITLAVLLDSLGWSGDAYDLVRDVDPSDVPCRCCLQKAMSIFRDTGDLDRFESFRAKAEPAC
ncbi:tetratricopeptide repeat protein [Singulisphaera sp. PoT]|uniref:tetratricopeptide repeat protein n=1 Tax=Singulisphaera sp. PoT TaxID=3411797 RepID=UPI003BF45DCE